MKRPPGLLATADSPGGPWVFGGLVLVVLGLIARNLPVALVGGLVAGAVPFGWAWSRLAPARVTLERAPSADRLHAGEEITLQVSLANRKPLPLPWIVIEDRVDSALEVLPAAGVRIAETLKYHRVERTLQLGAYRRTSWTLRIACPRRGYHRIGMASARFSDPFGFFERTAPLPGGIGVLVYPRLLPLAELDPRLRFPWEGRRTARALLDDPLNIVGARPYAETDTRRQVHWRASARSPELQSKVLRPTAERSVLLFVDLATAERSGEGTDVVAVERAISAAATVASRAHAARWGVGLLVNAWQPGTRQGVRIGVGRGDEAYRRVMDVLARVPPYFVICPLAELLSTERRRLPSGATVVAVSAAPTTALRVQVEACRRQGADAMILDVGRDAAAVGAAV